MSNNPYPDQEQNQAHFVDPQEAEIESEDVFIPENDTSEASHTATVEDLVESVSNAIQAENDDLTADIPLPHNREYPIFLSPDTAAAIVPDEDALAFHGMRHPGEAAQPFDLSILDDPEFDIDNDTNPSSDDADQSAAGENEAEDAFLDVLHAVSDEDLTEQDYSVSEEDSEEFDEIFHAPPAANSIPNHSRPARKGRPRRKKGEGLLGIPNILVTLVWLALTLVIGVTLGRILWVCASDVLAFGREEKAVTITVYESDSIEQITDKLHNAGLIRYPGLFKLYASFAVDEGEIHPGIWDLNTLYDYHALVKMMSPSSTRAVIKVMIPEGYSCRQIFDLLEENKVCTAVDIAAYAANGELDDHWFLSDVTRGDKYCLEGFLFPDTYEFYKNDSPRNVLEKMLNNFDNRFNEELQEQVITLNEQISEMMRSDGRSDDYIAAHQMRLRDIIIVASMVEKESANAQESYTIASVIYNRLYNWGGTPAFLNIDASIIYALDGKTNLTSEDLKVDSPYNTYYNTGLTPGPISNPGLASIKAALSPAKSGYYFYVLDPTTGAHHFSATLEEHEAFRASLR